MARPATGREVLAQAKAALASARTKEALREAQAVLLPPEHGLSMDEVAAILGISSGWACKLQRRFISSGGRRRENMTFEDEVDFLAPYLEKAARGGILAVCRTLSHFLTSLRGAKRRGNPSC
jgi:hypothetical protein